MAQTPEAQENGRQAQERRTVAATKRILQRKMMAAGCPKRDSDRIVSRMPQKERLKRLSVIDLARIAWEVRR
jgi:hypothetical protein